MLVKCQKEKSTKIPLPKSAKFQRIQAFYSTNLFVQIPKGKSIKYKSAVLRPPNKIRMIYSKVRYTYNFCQESKREG